jgi:hypothetical protein
VTMPQKFNVVIEQDEAGYFVASVPSLPGCHTQAKSLDLLMERSASEITLNPIHLESWSYSVSAHPTLE